jgi:hypothetical protein
LDREVAREQIQTVRPMVASTKGQEPAVSNPFTAAVALFLASVPASVLIGSALLRLDLDLFGKRRGRPV